MPSPRSPLRSILLSLTLPVLLACGDEGPASSEDYQPRERGGVSTEDYEPERSKPRRSLFGRRSPVSSDYALAHAWGPTERPGSPKAPRVPARFLGRTAATDSSGRLYFSDGFSIRRLEPSGISEVVFQLSSREPREHEHAELVALDVLPDGKLFVMDRRGCLYESPWPGDAQVFHPRISPDDPRRQEHGPPLQRECSPAGRMESDSAMVALDEDTLLVVDRKGFWEVRREDRELVIACDDVPAHDCRRSTLEVDHEAGRLYFAEDVRDPVILAGEIGGRSLEPILETEPLKIESAWNLSSFAVHPEGGLLLNMEKGLYWLSPRGETHLLRTDPPVEFLWESDWFSFTGPSAVAPDGSFYLFDMYAIFRGTPTD